MSASDAAQSILDTLKTAGIATVTHDPAKNLVVFPAFVLGTPELGWTTYSTSLPTDATFTAFVVVKSDGYALPALESAVSEVVAALWAVQGAVVTEAIPAVFPAGGAQLPAYALTIEVAL